MINSKYETETAKVYSKIYHDRYKYHRNQTDYTKKLILKNLKQAKIKRDEFKNMKVMNIGTGVESVVFNHIGVKKVYHFDLSSRAVNNLKNLSKKRKYNNIHSTKKNVVREKIKTSEKINFVFLQGVIHHFSNVENGLKNIIKNIDVKGKIFLRIYKSGSLGYFYVDFIRKFLDSNSINLFDRIFKKRFKLVTNSSGQVRTDFITYLYNHCIDNIFVPSVFLIDRKSLQKFFKINGFKNIYKGKSEEYFHNDLYNKKFSSISYIFQKEKNFNYKKNKINHVDQLNIKYKEKNIKELVSFLKDKLNLIRKLNPESKINLAIDLFFIVEAFRYQNSFLKKDIRIKGKKLDYPKNLNDIYKKTILIINNYINNEH